MDGKIEQRVCIKFCVKLGKSATETLETLCEAFGGHSLNQRAVFEWHSRFMARQVSAEDDERSGQPNTSKMTENVEKIQELIHENSPRTIHELTNTNGISYGVCHEILTENFIMHCTDMKFVPRLLTNDQKQRRVHVCLELQEKANKDSTFISRMIMGDESWIYSYDSETKQQLSQWKSPQ
jgi:hypothetical protein